MNGYDIYLTNNMNQTEYIYIYIVDKYDIYNFTNNNWSVVSEHGDAQDGYLLVNMIMTYGSYGILEYPVFLQTLGGWWTDKWCLTTIGCSQLMVPGRCMHSSLGSVAVEQRREAASTSESFTFCNLLCLCVLPRTRSLQNYKLDIFRWAMHLFSWQLRTLRFLASAFGQRRVLNMFEYLHRFGHLCLSLRAWRHEMPAW
jgi:hypothetical protein